MPRRSVRRGRHYIRSVRWQVHGERVLYDSDWVRLALVDVEIPGGERFEHHVVRMPNKAAGTVVHDPDRGVLLLWRHRFITDTWGWEIPAGGIDPGETPEAGRGARDARGDRLATGPAAAARALPARPTGSATRCSTSSSPTARPTWANPTDRGRGGTHRVGTGDARCAGSCATTRCSTACHSRPSCTRRVRRVDEP